MKITLPPDFCDLLHNQIPDWEAFKTAHQHSSPASIRLHPQKGLPVSKRAQVPWCKNGFYLKSRPRYFMDPLFHAGVYYPQEAGSMLLHHALHQLPIATENLRVLDMCAAPGGKSTILLDWLNGNGFMVSNEIIPKRAKILEENLNKWGYANRLVSNSDPEKLASLKSRFDLILIDAPCSGEGMFRKEPDALQMWSKEIVQHCQTRQKDILKYAAECVEPGGWIIYSTCTYNPIENEAVLATFMAQTGAESFALDLPNEWNIVPSDSDIVHGYRCYPHKTQSEGFFISILKMPGEAGSQRKPRSRKKKKSASHHEIDLSQWLKNADQFSSVAHRDEWYFLPKQFKDFALSLAQQIHVLSVGNHAGRDVHGVLIPAPSLALSTDFNKENIPTLDLDEHQVLNYLCRTEVDVDTSEKGLILCTYRNQPLGWAKIIGGKLKNRWPKEWRILHPNGPVEKVI